MHPFHAATLVTAGSLLLMTEIRAADPAWWQQGNPPVITLGAASSNKSPVTVGQAKWMAKSALDNLATLDPDLAGEIEALLTVPQPIPGSNPPANRPAILDFTVPAAPAPAGWAQKQRAPLLLGQLKAIAAPFYDAFHARDEDWLAEELTANGTKDPLGPEGYHYPWTHANDDDSNRAIATIGQLKAVFALHFEELYTDADADGLPDHWEEQHFSDQDEDPGGDPDGDGLPTAREFEIGSNPAIADTDGDGMGDGYEEAYFSPAAVTDPGTAVPAHGPTGNPDGDALTNLQEYQKGGIPTLANEQGSVTAPNVLVQGKTLRWFGVRNALYRIRYSTNLTTWQQFEPTRVGENGWFEFYFSDLMYPEPTTGYFEIQSWSGSGDTDGDLIPDAWEVANGLNFLDHTDAGKDSIDDGFDGDGLTNLVEYQNGLDPRSADTDGDGYEDAVDINLAGYWKLDETTATQASDASGHNRHGTLLANGGATPALTWTTTGGVKDGALAYPASPSSDCPRLSLPGSALNGATDFSVSLWFKTATDEQASSTAYSRVLVSASAPGNPKQFELRLQKVTKGQYKAIVELAGDAVKEWTFSTPVDNAAWHHFVHTRRATLSNCAIDGVGFQAQTCSTTALTTDSNGLLIGQKQTSSGVVSSADTASSWKGSVDEIRIYRPAILLGKTAKLLAPYDQDGDGLADWWEIRWFGNLNQNASEDSDGDGATNASEFRANTSPSDYFNGEVPAIAVVSGGIQSDLRPGGVSKKIVFEVTRPAAGNAKVVGAPVKLEAFAVVAGVMPGNLSFSAQSPGSLSDTAVTNSLGQVTVYFHAR